MIIKCFDAAGDNIENNNIITFEDQELNVPINSTFGNSWSIKIPNMLTRLVNIELEKVMFDDDEVIRWQINS